MTHIRAQRKRTIRTRSFSVLSGILTTKDLSLIWKCPKPIRTDDRLKVLDGVIKNLYGEIMVNPSMAEFNKAKNAMDGMLAEINNVITACANGEDPETCPSQPSGCSGSCSSCGGCH